MELNYGFISLINAMLKMNTLTVSYDAIKT
jgi:hypothetical protein